MNMFIAIAAFLVAVGIAQPSTAQSPSPAIGIVIMHGKGGSPKWHVSNLASSLEAKGYLVANLEMPWSGSRSYDVNAGAAVKEVESALDTLRSKGAKKLFVAGHSQGGLFALYFGGKQLVDGVIAIAPGGDMSNPTFREKLGATLDLARRLVAEGKGDGKERLSDYENAKGTYTIVTTPSAYVSWFDPDGAMNQTAAVERMNPRVPVLFIVPTEDYAGLRKVKDYFFSLLPKNPLSKLYEPVASHVGAPSASRDEIVRWTTEVAGRANLALQVTPLGGHP
jgi:dienelactone hydrolase